MIHLENPQNVAEYLSAAAKAQPDVTAMLVPKGRGRRRHYQEITYAELEQRSNLIAQGLGSAGIVRGDRVALMVKPSVELFALTFALFKAGVVPVIVDPGIGVRSLKECLRRAAPTGFIGIPTAHAARIALGLAKDSIKHRITVGTGLGHTLRRVEAAGKCSSGLETETQIDDIAAILFTSGSTGVPKGVVYRHRQFLAQVSALQSLFDFSPGEVDLPTFPLFALFDPALGMTTVVPYMDATKPAAVDPEEIIGPINRFSVTTMFGSPALLDAVGRYGERQSIRLPTLRRVIAAGAPLPAETMTRWHQMMPDEGMLYPPYGATESLPIACLSSQEILNDTWKKLSKEQESALESL